MNLFDGLFIIAIIHFFAAISPGPDVIFVINQTINNGRKAGIISTIGICAGLSFHIGYCILGLAAIIVNSEFLLNTIKIIGGLYLIYLGFSNFRSISVQTSSSSITTKTNSYKQIFIKGLLCNILNPKATMYFLSIFTIILLPNLPQSYLLIYGTWMIIVQFFTFSLIVFLLSTKKINTSFHSFSGTLNKIFGLIMIFFGIKVLLDSSFSFLGF